jgi:hypothetical protein
VMAVDIDMSDGFRASRPRRLFTGPSPPNLGMALEPDASRLLFATTPNAGRAAPFTVVLNWQAALKK